MVSLNESALAAVRPILENPDIFGVVVERGPQNVLLADFGIDAAGGNPAALAFSKACMAGMAEIHITSADYGALPMPTVNVATSSPTLSCMASQYAGWTINRGKYFAMGSGPARALVANEEIFSEIDHQEKSDVAVLCMETVKKPDTEVIEYIQAKIGVVSDKLYILMAPTSSMTGSVQVSARVVETAIHKMHEIGFALADIVQGCGAAPIAPIHPDPLEAIGRTNDCVLYGGVAHITVDCEEDFLVDKIANIPSSSSKDYGRVFRELFAEYGDFYKIDPLLFSPAQVTLANVRTGSFHHAGRVNPDLLAKSFGMKR